MSRATENYQLLIDKLDAFVRKYYINQLIRGSLWSLAVLLSVFLVMTVVEYFFYLPSGARTIMFFGFLLLTVATLFFWVLLPVLHYFRLGSVISYEMAARIIGNHFVEVQDRLLNVLQLKQQADHAADAALIHASINQKIAALRLVPFKAAVNLRVNKKYLPYLYPSLLVVVVLLLSAPTVLTEGTYRIIRHDTYFEPQAPFQFVVEPEQLQTLEQQSVRMRVRTEGSVIPQNMSMILEDEVVPLQRVRTGVFEHTFVKPKKSLTFYLEAANYRSRPYTLTVLPRPVIARLVTELSYPAYLKKTSESLVNIGDLTVPEGTDIRWRFQVEHVSDVQMRLGDALLTAEPGKGNEYVLRHRAKKDMPYRILISGSGLRHVDSVSYQLTVVPDRYPTINADTFSDSTLHHQVYFVGTASDDHGISRLLLHYRTEEQGLESGETYQSVAIPIRPAANLPFTYVWDLASMGLTAEQDLAYFLEVWDNDEVNGNKSTRTPVMRLRLPSGEELQQQAETASAQLKEDFVRAIDEAKKLKKDFEKLRFDLLNKSAPTWEDKQRLEDLLRRQQTMMQRVEQLTRDLRRAVSRQETYRPFNEQLLTKAEQLQKLMDELLTPEMKELMRKLEELLHQLNKDKAIEPLQMQKFNNEQLQKELDRILELYKKLELEKKMDDWKRRLDELAQKQEQLSQQTEQLKEKQTEENQQVQQQQEKIENQFEQLQEELSEMREMNEQLEYPAPLPNTEAEQQQAGEHMDQAMQNLRNKEHRKAAQQQRQAAQQMRSMSRKMELAMQSMQMQQMEMDLQATRQILDNLLHASFDQESLMEKTQKANTQSPQYTHIMQKQKNIADDLQIIKDSITELSRRVFQLQHYVKEQVTRMDRSLEQALEQLEQRRPLMAAAQQQHIMTAINNLALMFDELLQQFQQQMSAQMAGTQMCQRPGGQRSGRSNLSEMQQQLNDRIEQLNQQIKEGKMQPGGRGMSKEIAEMAQQQARIREALRQLNEELNRDGKKALGDLEQLMKQMEKTETELLNKQLTAEMLKRQQEIMTRLLEAEHAEREREVDNQRQAQQATQKPPPIPPAFENYLKSKHGEWELFKTVPPDLKPFYRQIVEQYYKSLNQ